MRVSFALNYASITNRIFDKQKDIRFLQNAISEGKALLEPSQNPLSWARVMDFKTAIKKAEQWKKNIDFGTNWNNSTEGHLNNLNDLLTRAREIAVESVKVNSPETIASYVKELDQIIREALNAANATYQDRYIFAPYADVSTPLFGHTEVNGEITSITDPATPSDLNRSLDIFVSENTSARINVNGEKLFFDSSGESILKNLLDLKTAIQGGDSNAINMAMGNIESDQGRVLEALTTVGVNLNRFEARQNTIDSIIITQHERLDDLEEADMTKIATDYQMKITSLQALYTSTTNISRLSLLQYL